VDIFFDVLVSSLFPSLFPLFCDHMKRRLSRRLIIAIFFSVFPLANKASTLRRLQGLLSRRGLRLLSLFPQTTISFRHGFSLGPFREPPSAFFRSVRFLFLFVTFRLSGALGQRRGGGGLSSSFWVHLGIAPPLLSRCCSRSTLSSGFGQLWPFPGYFLRFPPSGLLEPFLVSYKDPLSPFTWSAGALSLTAFSQFSSARMVYFCPVRVSLVFPPPVSLARWW